MCSHSAGTMLCCYYFNLVPNDVLHASQRYVHMAAIRGAVCPSMLQGQNQATPLFTTSNFGKDNGQKSCNKLYATSYYRLELIVSFMIYHI